LVMAMVTTFWIRLNQSDPSKSMAKKAVVLSGNKG